MHKKQTLNTLLAFDVGTKTVGIAVGNGMLCTARGLTTLKVTSDSDNAPKFPWQTIDDLIKEWRPDALVVGLPLHMDGSRTDMTRLATNFINTLREKTQLDVHSMDERLSSNEAKANLKARRNQGLKSKRIQKEDIDAEAARIILMAWMHQANSQ